MKTLRLIILCLFLFVQIPSCTVSINPLPHMYVYQGTNILMSGTGSYDFGNVYVDSTSSSVPIVIKNI